MTVELYDKAPPNSQAFYLAWLLPLTGIDLPVTAPFTVDPDTLAIGAKRWQAGMPLPYRMIRVIPGGNDLITSYAKIRVHTFHETYTQASHEADRSHLRMMLLADDPLLDVLMFDGSTANCASLSCCEESHEEPYTASSVVTRFVAEYDSALRLTPVPT